MQSEGAMRTHTKITLLGLGLLILLSACSAKADPGDMINTGPFVTLKHGTFNMPASWNPSMPLSDQANSGRWVLDTTMSQDFNTGAIDQTKWLTGDPNTDPRFSSSLPQLAVPTPDGLELRLQKGPTVNNHVYRGTGIYSVKPILYGYIEAAIKVPADYANNNIFLYAKTPQLWTEIDIMETYPMLQGRESKDFMNAHVWAEPGVPGTPFEFNSNITLDQQRISDNYHVYGLAWTQAELDWYIDGKLVRRGPNTYFHQPLNISAGCWDTNKNDALDPSLLPAKMMVKYVRVWHQG
jgi:beta-glucanase (GH16 family)